MSQSQTRKEVIAALDAEVAARNAQTEAHAAEVKTLTDTIAAHVAEIATLKASIDAATTAHAELLASVETMKAELVAAGELAKTEKANSEKIAADLNKAQRALADPKFIDAAMIPMPAGAALQAANDSEANKPAETQSVVAQWDAITDPKSRREFYLANRDAIKAELKKGG